MLSETGWLRFEVAERAYALPLAAIAEVTRASRLHLIPRVPLDVAGIVNFRGEPLPAIDGGAALLGRPLRDHRHLVVLQRDALRLGLLVKQVARIDRELRTSRKAEENEVPELPFVEWVSEGDVALGLVQPEGLIDRAKELLTEQRSEGEPCHNAF